jgi:hypothetical protein
MIVLHSHLPCVGEVAPEHVPSVGLDVRSVWSNEGVEWICGAGFSLRESVSLTRYGTWTCSPLLIYVGY